MSKDVKVLCTACEADFKLPYIMLGAPYRCPSCLKDVIPIVPVGTVFPETDHAIRFDDFKSLITYKAYKDSIRCLLEEWYGYRIEGDGDMIAIKSSEGKSVAPVELHCRIQNDPIKQQIMYRTAMALWR